MPKSPDFPKNRTIGEVIANIRKPHPLADTAWYKVGPSEAHGVNFTNSAHNYPGSTNPDTPVSWYMSDDGEIRIRGVLEAAVGAIFRLPVEARPEFSQTFICATEQDSTEEDAVIHFDIKFRAFEEQPDVEED